MTATKTPGSLTPTSTSERTMSMSKATARKGRLNWLLGLTVVIALTLGLLHQSVGRAQQEGDGTATPEASREASPGATPTVAITPEPDARQLKLTFTELNDSGVTGTTTLFDAGDRTIVDIDVQNTGADHPAHIHKGTCGQLDGQPAYTLASVHEDGKSRSVVDASLDDLVAGGYAIDLHLSPADLGTLIDCVDITGEPAVPDTNATPTVTATATTGVTATTTVTSIPTDAVAPTGTVTPSAISAGGTATESPSPTTVPQTPSPTPTATVAAIGGDGTDGSNSGGSATITTPAPTTIAAVGGDGTSGTTSGAPSGSTGTSSQLTSSETTVGDGTGGDVTTVNFTANSDATTTTRSLATTGSGPLDMLPGSPIESMILAMSSFALILLTTGIWIWRGERRHSTHRHSPRWSRLGM